MLNSYTLMFKDVKMNNGFTKYRYNQMFFPFCFYVLMDGLFSVYRI